MSFSRTRFVRHAATVVVMLAAASITSAQDVCDGVSPVDPTDLKAVAVVTGLNEPVFVTAPPGDTDRLFIVEQPGAIKIWHRGDPPGTTTELMDISTDVNSSGSEQGLLSMAFDPDFANNRFFYVYYTIASSSDSRVSRFEISSIDPDTVVADSELELLRIPQPQSNHNGGLLLFDPDGYLQIFTGDGGGASDNHGLCGNAQSLETLLGKILRIDVSGLDPFGTAPDPTCMTPNFTASTYTVPSDNPLSDGAGFDCDEIYAYGLRNPWRASFDPATGDLWMGDVGQDCTEEVNRATPSEADEANYGWRVMEGENCFDPADRFNCASPGVACGSSPTCNDPSLHDPIVDYPHGGPDCAVSVIGGYRYRGCSMPSLDGTYFYGEYCGWIKSFELDGSGNPTNQQDWTSALDPSGGLSFDLLSFGVDAQQEIYIADQSGSVLRIGPLFTDFEVSGPGAGMPVLAAGGGDWTWEDLQFTTIHPVDYYRVYRGVPNGNFSCIHSTADPEWVGGDPDDPLPGELFAYIVTAVSGTPEEETSSGDPPRTLTNPCPPPSGCNDGVREDPEVCDGSDLGGETCQSQGFTGGVLACNATCDGFDTSTCSLCGNNVCELFGGAGGEDCLSCAVDCNGAQSGNPQNRYCCGNAGGENPVDCSDPRCTGDGNTCAP